MRYEVKVGVDLQGETVMLGRTAEDWSDAVSQAKKLGEKFAIVFIQKHGDLGMGWVIHKGKVWTWQEWCNPTAIRK